MSGIDVEDEDDSEPDDPYDEIKPFVPGETDASSQITCTLLENDGCLDVHVRRSECIDETPLVMIVWNRYTPGDSRRTVIMIRATDLEQFVDDLRSASDSIVEQARKSRNDRPRQYWGGIDTRVPPRAAVAPNSHQFDMFR